MSNYILLVDSAVSRSEIMGENTVMLMHELYVYFTSQYLCEMYLYIILCSYLQLALPGCVRTKQSKIHAKLHVCI